MNALTYQSDQSGIAAGRVLALVVLVGLALAGLGIARGAGEDSDVPPEIPAEVTYAEHIAPIINENCVGCHRDGTMAPFALTSYEEVRERAPRLARATARKIMPPWLPESDGSTFVGERHLTDHQIALFQEWAESGTLSGDLATAPPPPAPSTGWLLGEPDLVVDVPPYTLAADGHDVYRNIVVPIPIDRPRYVTSVELRPGDANVVHHARMMIDSTDSSAALDREDPSQPGFDGMELISNAHNPQGHFLGWTPGKGALPPLEGMAWQLDPGTDLVLQLHMRTTGQEERVESQIGFYFTDEPPVREPVLLLVSSLMIDIPAGASDYRVTNSYELPVDVDVLSIYPHAHYLGKDLQGFATKPDGTVVPLIRIPDWDFNWQDEYRFQEPIPLPAGSVLTLDFTFDNSAENPNNPSSPPRRVVYGSNSMDEMADLIIQVLPRNAEDRATLIADAAWQNETEDMAYMAAQEFAAGARSLSEGDADQALFHFRESMQYRLDHPGSLTGLARAFLLKDDAASAVLVAERGVEVTNGRDPSVLAVLAEAYAASGDERAGSIADAAIELAERVGNRALADSVRSNLARYR